MSLVETCELLRCPISRQDLLPADQAALEMVREAFARSDVSSSGTDADLPEQAVINASGTYAYVVKDGIFMLTPDHAISLMPEAGEGKAVGMRSEKELVRRFYDEWGWTKQDGEFGDTIQFVDTRPVSQPYLERCHQRLKRYLPKRGKYMLDVASGAIPHDAYLAYSEGFEKRICVDLSHQALRQAKAKLGDRGIYIVGDLTNLPLRDGVVDAAISLHTIYHIPADEQRSAFEELYRVLMPEGSAHVVYTFGTRAPFPMVINMPFKLVSRMREKLGKKRVRDDDPDAEHPIYYHPHSASWFARQDWDFKMERYCCRSIGKDSMQYLFHKQLFGEKLLALLFSLEDRFPKFFGTIGQYPLIVIRKEASPAPGM